jgi:hypothetical protein
LRFLAAVLVANGMICLPCRAGAGASGVVLRWSAPNGCPDRDAVEKRVIALAGSEVAIEAEAAIWRSSRS